MQLSAEVKDIEGYILFQLFYCLAPWSDSSCLRILEALPQQFLAHHKLLFEQKKKEKYPKIPTFKELAGPAEAAQDSATPGTFCNVIPTWQEGRGTHETIKQGGNADFCSSAKPQEHTETLATTRMSQQGSVTSAGTQQGRGQTGAQGGWHRPSPGKTPAVLATGEMFSRFRVLLDSSLWMIKIKLIP